MPEIGATLREARQRRKVDLMAVEGDTKIRARYLAALEEEAFDVLPGPTYVKSFLRTYAEYLGLDAKLLVEEYKQRYERPTPQELTPFSTNLGSRRERRRARGPVVSPGAVIAISVLLLLASLTALGVLWPTDDGERAANEPTPTATATPTASKKKKQSTRKRKRAATPKNVRVQIVPEGPVYVCLESAAGKPLINKATLQAGRPSRRFTGRRFRVTFGNGQVRMRVGKRSYPVPETRVPLGYEIRPGRSPRRLSDGQRPTCT